MYIHGEAFEKSYVPEKFSLKQFCTTANSYITKVLEYRASLNLHVATVCIPE